MEGRNESGLQISVLPTGQLTDFQREELLSLCSRAYEEDFTSYLRMLNPAVHVLGGIEGRLVAHLAWIERELRADGVGALRTAYVEAVATLPEFQRRGFASQLLTAIPPLIIDFDLGALSPSAEPFYARLGWERWRGPLSYRDPDGHEVETPEDEVMIYRLPRTPRNLDVAAGLSADWRPIEVW